MGYVNGVHPAGKALSSIKKITAGLTAITATTTKASQTVRLIDIWVPYYG
jgi:hypothetical protein